MILSGTPCSPFFTENPSPHPNPQIRGWNTPLSWTSLRICWDPRSALLGKDRDWPTGLPVVFVQPFSSWSAPNFARKGCPHSSTAPASITVITVQLLLIADHHWKKVVLKFSENRVRQKYMSRGSLCFRAKSLLETAKNSYSLCSSQSADPGGRARLLGSIR